jgi:chromosome transmission fidelity protein 1
MHALWINQTLSVLHGLIKVSNDFAAGTGTGHGGGSGTVPESKMVDTTQLISDMAGANDQVNLMEMVKYLRESKLARKVSGFVEMTEEEAARKGRAVSKIQRCNRVRKKGQRLTI